MESVVYQTRPAAIKQGGQPPGCIIDGTMKGTEWFVASFLALCAVVLGSLALLDDITPNLLDFLHRRLIKLHVSPRIDWCFAIFGFGTLWEAHSLQSWIMVQNYYGEWREETRCKFVDKNLGTELKGALVAVYRKQEENSRYQVLLSRGRGYRFWSDPSW